MSTLITIKMKLFINRTLWMKVFFDSSLSSTLSAFQLGVHWARFTNPAWFLIISNVLLQDFHSCSIRTKKIIFRRILGLPARWTIFTWTWEDLCVFPSFIRVQSTSIVFLIEHIFSSQDSFIPYAVFFLSRPSKVLHFFCHSSNSKSGSV